MDFRKQSWVLLLLCMPFGVTIANPFTVPMLRKFGVVNSTVMTHLASAVMFILPVLMPNIWLLAISLFLAGISYSCLNIAMNTCASEIEMKGGKLILSTMHGLWSLGAMTGAAGASAIMGMGVTAIQFVACLLSFNLLFIVLNRKPLAKVPEPSRSEETGKKKLFIWPNRELWVLICIGLMVSLTEGSMADWAGVYMRDVIEVPAGRIGWGYAIYALFMASGRLLGDGLIYKFGVKRLLQIGGVTCCVGLFILFSQMGLSFSLFGFILIGAGVSIGSPILYAESAKVPGLPTGAGLATFNTFAMIGFLGGPAFIGFLAEEWSLPIAFAVVGVGAFVWSLIAKRV